MMMFENDGSSYFSMTTGHYCGEDAFVMTAWLSLCDFTVVAMMTLTT